MRILTITIFLLLAYSCNCYADIQSKVIRLHTSTTTTNSGLMKQLIQNFEAQTGYTIKLSSFGSGRALRNAREGLADLVLVHAPIAEQSFVEAGFGIERTLLMQNNFILAGPSNDPANVSSTDNVINAFRNIQKTNASFISRGDDSGTHKKELSIWKKTGIYPFGEWYIEMGMGMKDALNYASQENAYILVDRATWLTLQQDIKIAELLTSGARLNNPYHIILVNPKKVKTVNYKASKALRNWLISPVAQTLIKNFKIGSRQLFEPAIGLSDLN